MNFIGTYFRVLCVRAEQPRLRLPTLCFPRTSKSVTFSTVGDVNDFSVSWSTSFQTYILAMIR